MSKMDDFILRVDEAPSNDERWAEYKRKLNQYWAQAWEIDTDDWYIEQDKEKERDDKRRI